MAPRKQGHSQLLSCLREKLPKHTSAGVPSVVTDESGWIWDEASLPYNTRFAQSIRPIGIAFAEWPEHISAAVKCASQHHVPVTARSGGHSYAAYSLGGAIDSIKDERSLTIDMRGLRSLSYDPIAETVRVGSGAMLGELNEYLERHGRALPSGSCPTVGVGGQAVAGGFGLTSRRYGLLLDNMVSAEVILADGSAVVVSENSYPDLYWGMRGAGASLSIAHAFTFKTLPAPPTIIYFELTLLPRAMPASTEAIERAARLFHQFEAFGASVEARPELGLAWHVTPEPAGAAWGTKVEIIGQYVGSHGDFKDVIGQFERRLHAQGEHQYTLDSRALTYLESMHNTGGNWTLLEDRPTTNVNEHVNFYAKSLLTKHAIPNEKIVPHLKTLLSLSSEQNPSTNVEWFVLSPYLGGISSAVTRGPDAAFGHRDVHMVWELYAKYVTGQGTTDLVEFVNGMTEHLLPAEAVYPAYVDPELGPDQYPGLVWGDTYPRLQEIKAKYDPHDLFRFKQSVKLPRRSFGVLFVIVPVVVLLLWMLRKRLSNLSVTLLSSRKKSRLS